MAKLTRPWRMRWLCRSLALGVLLLLPLAAQAGPFSDFGYDTGAIGGANSQFVFGTGYGVLYSNPAVMSRIEPYNGIGYVMYKPELSIKLGSRSKSLDVPAVIDKGDVFSSSDKNANMWPSMERPLPTQNLQHKRSNTNVSTAQNYLTAGTIQSFNIPGFRFGGLMMLPLAHQVKIHTYYFDERESTMSNKIHFARFGEWSPIVTGFAGLSYAPEFFKYISLGLSLQVGATAAADINIYMPDLNHQNYSELNMHMQMALKFRPIVGMQIELPKPVDFWGLGFTWRNESYMDVDGGGGMALRGYTEYIGDTTYKIPRVVKQAFKVALDYEPMEVVGATGFRYKSMTVQAGVTWQRWSKYRDHHNESPQNNATWQDPEADRYLKDKGNQPYTFGAQDKYAWKDTVNVNSSISYNYLEEIGVKWVNATLGFAYKPTPVPTQDGRTNYADADLWCMSFGHRFNFDIPFKAKAIHGSADLGLQFWLMNQRKVYKTYKDKNGNVVFYDEAPDELETHDKTTLKEMQGLQTNNPGFPGYSQKGWLLVASASVNLEF